MIYGRLRRLGQAPSGQASLLALTGSLGRPQRASYLKSLLSTARLFHSGRVICAASGGVEGFLSGASASYIEDMYAAWLQDPKSVHVSWQSYFKNMGSPTAFMPPPTLMATAGAPGSLGYDGASVISEAVESDIPSGEILDHMKVQLMVRAYQVRGHHLAKLDPLEINFSDQQQAPELDYKHYGFTDADLDRKFHLGEAIESELDIQWSLNTT